MNNRKLLENPHSLLLGSHSSSGIQEALISGKQRHLSMQFQKSERAVNWQ
jgi:hypothetical protein